MTMRARSIGVERWRRRTGRVIAQLDEAGADLEATTLAREGREPAAHARRQMEIDALALSREGVGRDHGGDRAADHHVG